MAHRLQNIAIYFKNAERKCVMITQTQVLCTHDTSMNCKRGCKNWKIKKNWYPLIVL